MPHCRISPVTFEIWRRPSRHLLPHRTVWRRNSLHLVVFWSISLIIFRNWRGDYWISNENLGQMLMLSRNSILTVCPYWSVWIVDPYLNHGAVITSRILSRCWNNIYNGLQIPPCARYSYPMFWENIIERLAVVKSYWLDVVPQRAKEKCQKGSSVFQNRIVRPKVHLFAERNGTVTRLMYWIHTRSCTQRSRRLKS